MPGLKKLVSSARLGGPSKSRNNALDAGEFDDGSPDGNVTAKLRKRGRKASDEQQAPGSNPPPTSFVQDLFRKPALQSRKSLPKSQFVDNFTKWDSNFKVNPSDPQQLDRGQPYQGIVGMAQSAISLSSTLSPSPRSLTARLHREAQNAVWPLSSHSGRAGWKQSSEFAIGNIDWSQIDAEDLHSLTLSYNRPIFEKSSSIDSGISIPLNDRPRSKGKGKMKAVANNIIGTPNWPPRAYEARLFNDDNTLADHFRLVQEYERRQDDSDADYMMALLREEQRVMEEQLATEERERAQREEEDRLEAERLQAEEDLLAEQLAKAQEVECVCCGSAKIPADFPLHTPSAACLHAIQTCAECLQTWLASELDAHGVDALKCPECPCRLAHADVQRAASPATFAAYEKFLTRAALADIPNFTWCQNPACDSGQVNEQNENYMKCLACNYEQCVEHNVAWHKGESCEVYEYRTSGRKARDEERATEAMLDGVSKKCPGAGCGWRIQKVDGCDHMTCRRCRHEFCWQCLASHTQIKKEGNTAHEKWCKFHSENLATSWPFNMH